MVRSRFLRVLRNDTGAATVEAVLWMPTFVFLLVLVADTAIIFTSQAQVMRIIQDANRALSVGRFRTIEQTESFIASQLTRYGGSTTVETSVTEGLIVSRVTLPVANLSATPMLDMFDGLTLTISSEHLSEA